MKLATKVATVEGTPSFGEVKKMGMDESSLTHIVKSLTDMYSDPYLAIAREYISNAYDATVTRMGVASSYGVVLDKPIEVRTPNALNSSFVVRDHGTGMDREVLLNVFPKYGASTKRDTNNEIGGFGLGAKSALAVVNNFHVVSVKDGKKNTAIIQKGEDGVGEVTLLDEQITDESSGTTVTISFSAQKALKLNRVFRDSAVLMGFPSGSVRLNGEIFTNNFFNEDNYFQFGDHGCVSSSVLSSKKSRNYYDGSTEIYCLIGPIVYEIPLKYIQSKIVSGCSMVMNLPIGAVDLTPSRDNLIYTEKTLSALKAASKQLFEDVEGAMSDALENDAKSLQDVATMVTEFRRKQGNTLNLRYKGESIPELTIALFQEEESKLPLDERKMYWGFHNDSSLTSLIGKDGSSYYHGGLDLNRTIIITGVTGGIEQVETQKKVFNAFNNSTTEENFFWMKGVSDEHNPFNYRTVPFSFLAPIFTERTTEELSPWIVNGALKVITLEEWEKEYDNLQIVRKAAAKAEKKIALKGAIPTFYVSGKQIKQITHNPLTLSQHFDVVIYVQINAKKSDSIGHNVASILSKKGSNFSTEDVMEFIEAADHYYKQLGKSYALVRLPQYAKIEGVRQELTNAISFEEALQEIGTYAGKQIEDPETLRSLATSGHVARRGWMKSFKAEDLEKIQNEEVRAFFQKVRDEKLNKELKEEHILYARAALIPAFANSFEKLNANLNNATLYPVPLMDSIGAKYFDTASAIGYINLLYP